MKIKTALKKITLLFSKFFAGTHANSHLIFYRISSIDSENQIAILHFIQKNIFIKQTFSEIIANSEMIEGLSCQQACWIGIYYGMALRNALKGKSHLKNIEKPNYLLKHNYGSYKITCENRDGTIGCVHINSRKELNVHPLMIANDNVFIKQFDANQACYIGIL
ncbi:MAG: hypothetical protein COY58_00605 [Gammaproteobacteria bacterium CG_4_10_14_0_8_um_filter_38_16]|nr:MAG: hypothetical protein COY58_00605 [Gammaproteobacteria bacterium CG_4_10_14_0_8_um_filter_38_16]PJA04259.1 MAG: hypothetical protein COX72_01405 [Gammaproteobacteria bacterium CG_4_10_14_0_2_um_filter_38_22]PJB10913.1 MAG: hypothetical protein CO120_02220 [Gammaproteobacteria bacterium CG_4_9_14_3_um_filter_38_9]